MHKDDSRQETYVNWDKKDETWIAQAVAVIDGFSAEWVRTLLSRTTLKDPLKQDPAALREILLDESRLPLVRRRAAQQILMAGGIYTQEPMEPVVFMWDRSAQPPLGEIAATVREVSGQRRPVVMRDVDLGGDDYALVIADRAVTDDEALAARDAA